MKDDPDFQPEVGDTVTLSYEEGCLVPPGEYEVSKVNPDGSFHVGGNIAVWPRRIECCIHEHIAITLMDCVIGFTVDYALDPSQYEEGDPTTQERLVWGRVIDGGSDIWGEEFLFAEGLHDNEIWGVGKDAVHTIMPERY